MMAANFPLPPQPQHSPQMRSGRSRTPHADTVEDNWTPPTASPRFIGTHHQSQMQPTFVSATSAALPRPDMSEEILNLLETLPVLHCAIDFAKPDGLRNRALIVENRRLYICEYFMSIWSPVFRAAFFSSGQRDDKQALAVPNARYNHMLELLECMYPQHKPITGTHTCSFWWGLVFKKNFLENFTLNWNIYPILQEKSAGPEIESS